MRRSRQAVALGQELRQPSSLALAVYFAAMLQQCRREGQAIQENAETLTAIATEHGFTFWLAGGLIVRGWFLVEQQAWADGIAHLRDGLAAWAATNGAAHRTFHLTLLAEALRRNGQTEEGLAALARA